jgi:hypothetical protein
MSAEEKQSCRSKNDSYRKAKLSQLECHLEKGKDVAARMTAKERQSCRNKNVS